MIQQSLRNLARTVAFCGFIFIAACSTTPEKEDSDQGGNTQDIHYNRAKSAYIAGNFKLASALFSSLAKQGHADSQYSLGYMYYHGSGLSQDLKKAMDWFNLSAAQGNSNAITALATIHKHMKKNSPDQTPAINDQKTQSNSSTPVVDLRAKQNSATVTAPAPVVSQPDPIINTPAPVVSQPDPIVNTPAPVVSQPDPIVNTPAPVVPQPDPIINTPAPVVSQVEPTKTMPEPVTTPPEEKRQISDDNDQDDPSEAVTHSDTTVLSTKEIKSSRWILRQPSGYYTIQLSSSTSRSKTLNFIKQVELDGVYFFRSTVNQVDRYTVIHGSFPNYEMAKAKLSVLKKREYKNMWIRGMRGIQSAISRQ